MPIIKTGPRILHLYRQLKSGEPPIFENDDLSVIGDTPETRITASINTSEAQLKPWISRYQDDKLAFGYKPFRLSIAGSGFIAVIAGLTFLISALAHLHLSQFGIALFLISSGAVMMWLGGFSPFRHFIIFDRPNGLVHVSTRLRWWKYISLRWQDASFVNGHWVLPDAYKTKPLPTYDIKLLMPPTTLQRMGVVSYKV
ncbi:MAG: hypothetical protein LAT61_05600, partial [Alcanivorax sp.]|nr:hypothetical protein [Alcanivorax sp.]